MALKGEGTTQLKKRIKELEEQLGIKEQLIFTLNESIPEEQNERKKYMADITLFYNVAFRKKIPHFIGLQLEELAQIGRTEYSSNIIRANINCFRILDDWFKERVNEHLGNMEGMRNSFDRDNQVITELKDKYNQL